MPDKCPLGLGIYWNNRTEIPEFCLEHCEEIAVKASMGPGVIDILDHNCTHPVESDDQSLQRTEGSGRLYGILNACMTGCDESYAEEWEFICPND